MLQMDLFSSSVQCTVLDDGEAVVCNGTHYVLPEATLSPHDTMFWVYLGVYIALVLTAGLMSGLTIGLLSLDMMSLRILRDAGTEKQRKQAQRIMPIVEKHHLLLVTLLLCNAAAVESMPLFLDRISNPIMAVLVSVTAVLLFGEVFPQALCSRYGLAIGATLAPLVYFLMCLTFIVSWPIAKLLDCLLGTNHSTFFRRAELKALVDLHGAMEGAEGPLTGDEILIIKGAMEMKDKTVEDAMVKMDKVYMVELEEKMDKETLTTMMEKSHSRIPVYEKSRQAIRGILLAKTLISLDPDDCEPVSALVQSQVHCRPVGYVQDCTPLFEMLKEFQTGKCHLCMVYSSDKTDYPDSWSLDGDQYINAVTYERPKGILIGIITLEDVLEELLQEEILDEADVFREKQERMRLAQQRWMNKANKKKIRPHRYGKKKKTTHLQPPPAPPSDRESSTSSLPPNTNTLEDDPSTPLLQATT